MFILRLDPDFSFFNVHLLMDVIFFFIFAHICDTASHMLLETFCANVNQDKEKKIKL